MTKRINTESNAHPNYELLNLLGYGLAKFGTAFIHEFGYTTKTAFYEYFVDLRIVKTGSVIKNRQDILDPFFNNERKGWWQSDDRYLHRKNSIDHICGNMNVTQFATYVKGYIVDRRYTKV